MIIVQVPGNMRMAAKASSKPPTSEVRQVSSVVSGRSPRGSMDLMTGDVGSEGKTRQDVKSLADAYLNVKQAFHRGGN